MVLAIWLTAPLLSPGEDSVLVRGKGDQEPSRVVGQIVDYTGRGLVLRLPSGREQTIAAADVLEVHSQWVPQQSSADGLYAERRYPEALEAYRQALAAETRPWARRLLLARAVWCCQRSGR